MAAGSLMTFFNGTVTINSVPITNVKSFTPPQVTTSTTEATPIGQAWNTYVSGTNDPGEGTLSTYYDPRDTSQAGLFTLIGVVPQPTVTCVVAFDTGITMTFDTRITTYNISEGTNNDPLTCDFTLRADGEIVIDNTP